MLKGNQIQKAFVKNGFEIPKQKKRKEKSFTCNKCNTKMDKREDENFMVCPKCGNYFIFRS